MCPGRWWRRASSPSGTRPGVRATRLRRNPVESFTTVDRYDGAAFTA